MWRVFPKLATIFGYAKAIFNKTIFLGIFVTFSVLDSWKIVKLTNSTFVMRGSWVRVPFVAQHK